MPPGLDGAGIPRMRLGPSLLGGILRGPATTCCQDTIAMKQLLPIALALCAHVVAAAELTVNVHVVRASGVGESIGQVRLVDTSHGMALYPKLTALTPGLHGFHIHERPNCDPAEQGGAM